MLATRSTAVKAHIRIVAAFLALSFVGALRLHAQAGGPVDYARDVQPLLRANCYSCHGPTQQSGNFRIDRRRDVMPNRVGANNARVVPGDPSASKVYVRVSGTKIGRAHV